MPDRDAPFTLVAAGDSVLIALFEERIDHAVNARVIAAAARVRAQEVPGVRDVVPTFRSVAVYFDPLRTDLEALTACLEAAAAARPAPPPPEAERAVRIPVCYGGEFGPDLGDVAAFAGLPEADVIARHVRPVYRTFMLGFVPGFAYLGSVDPRIAAPRRATPRRRVPAGSVGIAGPQTGIYPSETPGGWQIVGRTPREMLDVSRDTPALLKPGDLVQFYAIDAGEFLAARPRGTAA
jgi:KipI family sensor histidine kinase inhibitor